MVHSKWGEHPRIPPATTLGLSPSLCRGTVVSTEIFLRVTGATYENFTIYCRRVFVPTLILWIIIHFGTRGLSRFVLQVVSGAKRVGRHVRVSSSSDAGWGPQYRREYCTRVAAQGCDFYFGGRKSV